MLAGLSIKLYFPEAILFPVVENQWILLNGYSLISHCFFLVIVIMLVAQSYLTFLSRLDFSLTSICWVLLCAKYISRCCGYRRVSVLSSLPTFWAYMSCDSPNYRPRGHPSQAEPMLRLVNSMVWPDIEPQTQKNSNKSELRFSSHPYAFEWGQAQRMKL